MLFLFNNINFFVEKSGVMPMSYAWLEGHRPNPCRWDFLSFFRFFFKLLSHGMVIRTRRPLNALLIQDKDIYNLDLFGWAFA